MNKLYTLLTAALIGISTSTFATQVDCSFTSISSNITTNTTLTAGTLYRVEGCIHVTNGHALTIPAGTTVMFQKSVDAALIIDKGATLNVNGTSGSPVVFTPDQTPGTKAYGDWSGLVILGNASNNVSGGSVSVSGRTCTSLSGGGSTDADNSGSITYLRIEYAKYGMTLLSVGSGTALNHIDISYAANDAYQFLGGTVNAKYLISYNAKGADFLFEYGNRSFIQYPLSVRLESTAHTSTGPGSNGVVMKNDETGTSNTPLTSPAISNLSVIGPLYCGATGLSSDFKNGVLMQLNTAGHIYNSVITGWGTGLRMEDNSTLNNADVNGSIIFDLNSFTGNTTDFSNNGTWPGSCAGSLSAWLSGAFPCAPQNNQFPTFTLGYNSSICGTYSTTTPTFKLNTTNGLSAPDYFAYDDLSSGFFDATDERGALNTSTDWTTFGNWNPLAFNPCPQNKMNSTTIVSNVANEDFTGLQLAPNPSNGNTYALFNAATDGNVSIIIVDNAGRVLRTTQSKVAKGNQRISVDTRGLAAGLYIIKVQSANNLMHAQLIVE